MRSAAKLLSHDETRRIAEYRQAAGATNVELRPHFTS